MTYNRLSKPILLLLLLAIWMLGSTASVAQVNVSLPDLNAGVGEQLTIPVTVGDLTGQNVYSYEITIVFDPAVLTLTGVSTSGTRSAAAGASVIPNTNNPGEIRIAAASGNAFSGSGTLVNLVGTVAGAGTTDMTFTKMVFNVGTPAAVTTNGSVSTEAPNQPPTAQDVSAETLRNTAVTITLSGSDADGQALSFAIASGPSNGSVGSINVQSETSATVVYTPSGGFTGTDSFTYTVSDGQATATGTVTIEVNAPIVTPVNVNLPNLEGSLGEEVSIPVQVDDITGKEILSYEFTLRYDPEVINLTDVDISGTLSTSSPVVNANTPGEIVVVFASATALSGSGTLVKVQGEVVAEGTSTLSFDRFVFNDGTPSASTTPGTFTVINLPPVAIDAAVTTDEDTAVQITLRGTDPEGEPLDIAIVTGPENGTLGDLEVETDTSVTVTYTPDDDFFGTDSFTFSVSDGETQVTGTVTITVVAVNDPPSASAILTPESGAEFLIGGGPGEDPVAGDEVLLEVSWEAAADVDGDAIDYEYQLATDAGFENVILSETSSSAGSFDVTVADAAEIFDGVTGRSPGNIAIGSSVTLHHRIVTSDGQVETVGPASTVVLIRGTIVSSESRNGLPDTFRLDGNYPNPFNPSTTIRFDLPESAEVSVQVVDVLGRQVLEVPAQAISAGAGRSVKVEAAALGSGTYIYRLVARTASEVKMQTGKMTIVK